jgi:integrase
MSGRDRMSVTTGAFSGSGVFDCRNATTNSRTQSSTANPKQIQTLMGHSSIKVTFDTYGHLFADAEADQRAAEGVEFRLLGA